MRLGPPQFHPSAFAALAMRPIYAGAGLGCGDGADCQCGNYCGGGCGGDTGLGGCGGKCGGSKSKKATADYSGMYFDPETLSFSAGLAGLGDYTGSQCSGCTGPGVLTYDPTTGNYTCPDGSMVGSFTQCPGYVPGAGSPVTTIPAGTVILYGATVSTGYGLTGSPSATLAAAIAAIQSQLGPALVNVTVSNNMGQGTIWADLLQEFSLWIQGTLAFDRGALSDVQGNLDSVVASTGLAMSSGSTICRVGIDSSCNPLGAGGAPPAGSESVWQSIQSTISSVGSSLTGFGNISSVAGITIVAIAGLLIYQAVGK